MNSFEIEQNIEINAKPEEVYNALTQNIANWWGRPYIINEQATELTLEPKVGGLFYESWGENEGFKWGEVTYIKNNEVLEITGTFGMRNAIHSKVCFTLSKKGMGTNVELSHTAFGGVDDKTKEGYSGGWKDLIGLRLKKFVEEGTKMGLGNEPSTEETMKQMK